MTDIEDRLIDLETRLAHHERMTEELSEVIARQDRTIDLLSAQLRRLIGRLQNLEGAVLSVPENQKPPHY